MNAFGIFVFACAALFTLLLLIPIKLNDNKIKRFLILTAVLTFVVLVANFIYSYYIYSPILNYNDQEVSTEAIVLDVNKDSATLFLDKGFAVKAYFDENFEVAPSTRIRINADVYGVDENRYAGFGIHAKAHINDWEAIESYNKKSFVYLYSSFRDYLENTLDFGDDKLSSFMNGIILGDISDVDGVFLNKFRTVGLSHIMSVSGMHLMFAVSFLSLFLSVFGLGYKKKAIICIFAAAFFVILSGFAVACVRSFIMILVMNIGIALDKEADTITSLMFSAYLILIFTPYNTLNISFVLSVLATFGLVVIGPQLSLLISIAPGRKLHFIKAIFNFIKNSLAASLGANIACVPVFLIIFKQINVLSPLVNLILIIPLQIIFYLGFVVLLLPFPQLKGFIATLYRPILECISKVVDFFFEMKYTTVSDGNKFFYLVFILLIILTIGILAYNILNKGRKTIYYYILGYTSLCIVLFSLSLIFDYGKAKIKIVDVGQGNACFASKDEKAVFFDCGGQTYTKVSDELRRSNIKRIELLAITHADFDHIGFVERILETYEVDKIVYPGFCNKENIEPILAAAKNQNTEIVELTKDTEYVVLGECTVKAFVEKAYSSKLTENTSALYKFSYENTSVNFTGDMNIHQEYCYLDYGNELDCDILVVPHHGSASSLYSKILKIYSPDYSVISVNSENKYGLPDKRIVDRLEACSRVLETSKQSTIIFEINNKGYKVLN